MTRDAHACSRCRRLVAPTRVYVFESEARCLRCALRHRPTVRKALAVSLVVGTILTAINHGDAIVLGTLTPRAMVKILLTYAVPFTVSVYSVLASRRSRPLTP